MFHPVYPHLTQVTHVSPCLPSFTPSYPRFTPFTLVYPKLPTFHPGYHLLTSFANPRSHFFPTFKSLAFHLVFPHVHQVTHVSPKLLSYVFRKCLYSYTLSSAEAPVSKHQRKKRERKRWREKTGARGTMGRGKRREFPARFNFSSSQPPRAVGIFFPKARL